VLAPRLRRANAGLGSLASGALTALSLLVVAAVSAVVGIVIAREFGRTDETDGFLAAYGVFIVIAIAAQAIRVAVLPQLARAWKENRLAGEIAGDALALASFALPLVLVAEFAAEPLAGLLTGSESDVAREMAADALRWVVPASCAYLFAGLAASGLAARNDYGWAALGFALGATCGLALIVLRIDDGILAVAWGISLNASISLLVPATALVVHAARERMPARAVRPSGPPLRDRLAGFGVGAAVPLAMQLLYVVCLPFAGRLGTGAATTFVYAYLASSSLVSVAAGSIGLATSVPLARAEIGAAGSARHVVAASWLALTFIGAAAGVFALAGGDVVEAVLGGAYGGEVGSDLGRLIVVLSPWIVAYVGITVAFPLAFVSGRTRGLPWIALAGLALQVPLAWAGSELLELDGLAFALALSTLAMLAVLLAELRALEAASRGLFAAVALVGGLAAVAFVLPGLVFASYTSAALGLVIYAAVLVVLRPRGLRASWQYLRTLG
jgi:hypothetical protein